MNCQTCNHCFTTQAYLPIIQQSGNTICLQCFKKSNPTFQNIEITKLHINKELIKMMGKCPEHRQTNLTLFNVKTKKRQCPKCVIYSKDKKKYQDCTFVQIDEQTNKIDNVLQAKLQNLQTSLIKIEQESVIKTQNLKRKILAQTKSKLDQSYSQMVKRLKLAYENQHSKIVNAVENFYQNQCELNFMKFQQIKVECLKVMEINSSIKNCQKYEKVSDSVRLYEQLGKIRMVLEEKSQNFSKIANQYNQKYECGFCFDIKLKEKQQELKRIQIKEEQILIDIEENNQALFSQQMSYIDFSDKFQQKSMRSVPSTQRTSITILTQKTLIQPLKNTFVATQISDLNKIQTQIKQIQAKNLNITNTDAKKIMSLVSKSFIKCLDLSGNKITGAFLKDLNKVNIGKYLKTIKLSQNDINMKDAAVSKKIEQLKLQGVNILL